MYPSLLKPNSHETIAIKNGEFVIPKIVIEFKEWRGKIPGDTFGNKPIIDYKGKPVFAELAILGLVIDSGWDGRWVETYARGKMDPKFLLKWGGESFKKQKNNIPNNKIKGQLDKIAELNNNSYSGCWDVVGWKGDNVIFFESKRIGKDRIRETQIKWLKSAMKFGLKEDNFLMVEWSFKK